MTKFTVSADLVTFTEDIFNGKLHFLMENFKLRLLVHRLWLHVTLM